jgi:hypothetical protein
MSSWLIRLRDLVWPAIFSVVFLGLAVIVAFFNPAVAVVLGLGSISLALLAQRA